MKYIERPFVAKELCMNAYEAAQKIHNEKAVSLRKKLRYGHYAVFYQLITNYARKIKNMPDNLAGTYENEVLGLWITRKEVADKLNVSPKTIYNILSRLQEADFIQLVFHGSLKPIEVRISKDLLIMFDNSDPEYLPKSKFLKASYISDYSQTRKTLPHINYITNTFNNNITITESGVFLISTIKETTDNQDVTRQNEYIEYKNQNQKNVSLLKISTKTREADFGGSQKILDAFDRENSTIDKAKVPAKKSEIFEKMKAKSIDERRDDAKLAFSRAFFAYIKEKLFADKIFSEYYRNKVIAYISEHYFAKTYTIEEMSVRWERNLKLRIDIAADYINKTFKGPDDKPFDRTYFFPLAFLDINKTDKNDFSFTKTNAFLKNSVKFKQLNGYNRALDKELRYKFNKICRAVETGHLNFFAAQQKIKSLTPDSSEYIKQFNARFSGVYTI